MYSHDGIRDALTQLAAPPLLYEELRREIATSRRSRQPLSVVRFVLAIANSNSNEVRDSSISPFQETIVRFAHTLSRFSRDEDICARMGEREFVCLLHGEEDAMHLYVARIAAAWREEHSSGKKQEQSPGWRLDVASLVSTPSEDALGLLNRLDLQPLNSWGSST